MKRYEKLCSCLMIVALCVAGLALGGCKKAREKKHKLSVATGAVVNSMMMTNPMGALFGKNRRMQTQRERSAEHGSALTGCPSVSLQYRHLALVTAIFLHQILQLPMHRTAW